MDGNNQYRPMVVYNPSAEYRLIDMNSSLTRIFSNVSDIVYILRIEKYISSCVY
ncbi:MAG: hypothetical protein ACKPKO_12145 [Candidatus Fonsibacter sp.]